jgi:uncharacterized protein YbcC (UPF0753/DUF2309 family)
MPVNLRPVRLPPIVNITITSEVTMKQPQKTPIKKQIKVYPGEHHETDRIREAITAAWERVAPLWPLQTFIACNPLQGYEDQTFEDALEKANQFTEHTSLPAGLIRTNYFSIKWCQAYYDAGQAVLPMPHREEGFYKAWKKLAIHDKKLLQGDTKKLSWLNALPESSELAIAECLLRLRVPREDYQAFMSFSLLALPGYAGYVKYRVLWDPQLNADLSPVNLADFLAVRLIITCLCYGDAVDFFRQQTDNTPNRVNSDATLKALTAREQKSQQKIIKQVTSTVAKRQMKTETSRPEAQLVFCIDVRSEPFRRAIEAEGHYETFGFAGFFGVPVTIDDEATDTRSASCPVLLRPQHTITQMPLCSPVRHQQLQRRKSMLKHIKQFYMGLKYSFTAPFALVEALGPICGLWMCLKTWAPVRAARLKAAVIEFISPSPATVPVLSEIDFNSQVQYAEGLLRSIGLTRHFAYKVVLCGHGSSSVNNAYASGLDCGACGGRHGGVNAQVAAAILNKPSVRHELRLRGIDIPQDTFFRAALHNTTTDAVTFYQSQTENTDQSGRRQRLEQDLQRAADKNCLWRSRRLGYQGPDEKAREHLLTRSCDWAQTRPEWGLAGNTAFIVAPRQLTQSTDLQGRAFLHSYDWEQDPSGEALTVILTAPMVVAQWINSQYLFSTLNQGAYGSGSKITQNITGKIGIMQGNSSDLMSGLALQSTYQNDSQPYHSPERLTTIVYAPRTRINAIIQQQTVLQKLFGNSWVHLVALDPTDQTTYLLQTDFTWKKFEDDNSAL